MNVKEAVSIEVSELSAVELATQVGKKSLALPRLTKEWELALKCAAFVLVGADYVCGYLYRDAYFSRFHLDIGLFSKSTAEYFLYGGYAAFLAASALLGIKSISAWQILLMICIAAVALGTYLALVALVVEWLSTARKRVPRVNAAARRFSAFLREKLAKRSATKVGITGAGAVLLAFYLLISSCLFIVFTYTIPNVIANAAADRQYETDRARFANGCEDSGAALFCFAVLEANGSKIAQGFLIETTTDYVALSDDGRTRVISLQGRQLVQLDMPVKH